MNKWLVATAAGLISIGAYADSWCGYKDYFRINDDAHPVIGITNSNVDGEVYLQILSPRSFIIKDTERCKPGYAHITISYDAYNWCNLDIKDGPWLMHPAVSASCQGIKYLGTSYDGVGTGSYTINLS